MHLQGGLRSLTYQVIPLEVPEGVSPQAAALVETARRNAAAGLKQEAEAALRRALELAPDYAAALETLGRLLLERGARDEALALLERAWALPR